jgi:GT2 family glycosyltransferase
MTTSTTCLLSILVPTWNRVEPTLRAIASVQAPSDGVEIIVVDNHSDPGVFERLQTGVKQFPDVRLYQNDRNLGMAKNWNQCIAYARGEWMGLLCSDDIYLEGAVARACSLLPTLQTPSLVVANPTTSGEIEHCPAGPETARSIVLPSASGNFWHRRVVETVGGFDERFEYSADAEFWYRVARYFPVVKVNAAFADYLRHSESYMWTTWHQNDFLQQIELLARVKCSHVYAPAECAQHIEATVDQALWETVLHIVASSFLRFDKQDIFVRYLPYALKRANCEARRKTLLAALAQVTRARLQAAWRRAGDKIPDLEHRHR